MNPGYHVVRFRAELPAAGLPAAFAVVTACNPNGKTVSARENEQATDALRSDLTAENQFFFPVIGGSPDFSHAEPGFGVLFKSPEEAVSWGRRYQQEAVFWINEGNVQLVPCDSTAPVELGTWQTLAEPTAQKPIFRFLGNPHLLHLPKTALFASTKCPGSVILPTYDQAARWRDEGHCIISGFHSPIEKECLSILLRGTSPVIICPARSLPSRLAPEWSAPLSEGRMLVLSPFKKSESRVTADLAARRNEYVASLADAIWLAHASDGGKLQKIIGICDSTSPNSPT
jgi:hypothetical protein